MEDRGAKGGVVGTTGFGLGEWRGEEGHASSRYGGLVRKKIKGLEELWGGVV